MSAPPVVPRGFATNAGLSAAAVQFVTAAALVVADHSPEAIAAFVGALVTLLTVLGGRFAQAAVIAARYAPQVSAYGTAVRAVGVALEDAKPGDEVRVEGGAS